MKTEFEYIKFAELTTGEIDKTRWRCYNKKYDEELGEIYWYSRWRQYIYSPTVQALYSAGCLNDIAEFLKQLKP